MTSRKWSVGVKQSAEAQLAKEAKERQREAGKTAGRGRPKEIASATVAEANGVNGETHQKLAEAVGMGHTTLAKAEKVVEAA